MMDGRLSAVRRFLCDEAGFAQLITVNREGFPIGRTVGAVVGDDWTVDLVQRRSHRRLAQLRRNPNAELIWTGTPKPGARNDHPAVYDFGWQVPRCVFLRGVAEFMPPEWTVEQYRRRTDALLAKGFTRAPARTDEDVAAELTGVLVHPVRLRAEGFGDGAQSFDWTAKELH